MSSNYQRDKANVDKYRRNNISRVAINIKKDEKALWEQMAAEAGLPLATLIRKLMKEYIDNRNNMDLQSEEDCDTIIEESSIQ